MKGNLTKVNPPGIPRIRVEKYNGINSMHSKSRGRGCLRLDFWVMYRYFTASYVFDSIIVPCMPACRYFPLFHCYFYHH